MSAICTETTLSTFTCCFRLPGYVLFVFHVRCVWHPIGECCTIYVLESCSRLSLCQHAVFKQCWWLGGPMCVNAGAYLWSNGLLASLSFEGCATFWVVEAHTKQVPVDMTLNN